MICGLLLRHYKNYGNLRFIPLLSDPNHTFCIYIGNNGVGKSAILEALDVVFKNQRQWNVTQGEKKSESYICPVFLIPKSAVTERIRTDIETVSNYFWSNEIDNFNSVISIPALKLFVEYKNSLKDHYQSSHYLIVVGSQYDDSGAFFASFNNSVFKLLGEKEDVQKKCSDCIKNYILDLYSYLYIPVEESPSSLLQLQNNTMQKLLNKDILHEIDQILSKSKNGESIIAQINNNLDSFINDVNDIISRINSDYLFSPDSTNKRKLTAKDIRTKVIEAYFPLRTLKVGNRRVDLLSSGEQRRAIIDVAYSTLMANRERKTEKYIVLAIDEPEISMHISNCFDQFSRLEELSRLGIQVVITTHWYGYLPIAQNGNMHYLEYKDKHTDITSFDLYSLMENRSEYPDDIELKSMFDLALSLVSYMRRRVGHKWIICEGSDDKIYLETMLNEYKNIHIIPLGGCANVIKLYRILYGFMTEKNENAKADILFLIDTDLVRTPVNFQTLRNKTSNSITLRRLQIDNSHIRLLDLNSGGTYEQTEIEDCLNPDIYYKAVDKAVQSGEDSNLKNIWRKYEFISDAKISKFRGDDACICATDAKFISKKRIILNFVENTENKYAIAKSYAELCKDKTIKHDLAEIIASLLRLEKRR